MALETDTDDTVTFSVASAAAFTDSRLVMASFPSPPAIPAAAAAASAAAAEAVLEEADPNVTSPVAFAFDVTVPAEVASAVTVSRLRITSPPSPPSIPAAAAARWAEASESASPSATPMKVVLVAVAWELTAAVEVALTEIASVLAISSVPSPPSRPAPAAVTDVAAFACDSPKLAPTMLKPLLVTETLSVLASDTAFSVIAAPV